MEARRLEAKVEKVTRLEAGVLKEIAVVKARGRG